MSRLGELSKLIGSINDRVDELCASKCKELGIDAEKAFKDVVRKRENVGEAVDGGLPQTTVDAVKDDNDGKFDADELINDPEKAKSVATAISGNGEDARRQKPPQSDDGEQSGYTVSDMERGKPQKKFPPPPQVITRITYSRTADLRCRNWSCKQTGRKFGTRRIHRSLRCRTGYEFQWFRYVSL